MSNCECGYYAKGIDKTKVLLRSSPQQATVHRTVAFKLFDSPRPNAIPKIKTTQKGGFIFGGAEGQPVLTTKLSKDYIYSFRGDSSLLG